MENIKYREATFKNIDPEEFNKTRTVTFIASDESRDAHGTVLNQEGWDLDRFMSNPIIGYQHNVYGDLMCEKPTPDDVIGKGKNIRVENGKLMVDIEFKPEGRSEIADKVAEDVRDGFLNTVSVGFIPKGKGKLVEEEDVETYHFAGQELLEISVVNIPSNANATAVRKSLREQTARGIMWVYRALNKKYSLNDLRDMTLGQIMDLVEGRKVEASKNNEDFVVPEEGATEYTYEGYKNTLEIEHYKLVHKKQVKK